jgi:hypothetical protein
MCLFHQLKQTGARRSANESLAFDAERVCDSRVAAVWRAQEFRAVCHRVHRRRKINSGMLVPRVDRKVHIGQLDSQISIAAPTLVGFAQPASSGTVEELA